MAFDRISYPIVEQSTEFTQRGNLFYIDRLMVEANTRGTIVTPSLVFEDTVVTLPTFSTTARRHVEIEINRIGSFSRLELTPVAGIQWYLVELVIRPMQLGVGLLPRGARQQFPGRSADVSTSLTFELKPFSIPNDARLSCIVTKRIYVDIVTGAETVTPVVLFADGTTQTLATITQATRGVVELSILAAERVVAIRLDGDFSHEDVVLYDIEVDMYLPGNVALGAA